MIYDFDEVLGRGIISTRTGRTHEAVRYLDLAAKLDPHSVRARLWQAAAAETAQQQQAFLQEALSLDPKLLVARVLLDRLHQQAPAVSQPAGDFARFTCPACGGQQRFDPDALALACTYCHKTELLAARNAAEAGAALEPALRQGAGNWAVLEGHANCGSCGARLSLLANRSTQACPFCGSEQITTQPATPGLVSPAALAPFHQHAEDVQKLLSAWWAVSPAELTSLLDAHHATLAAIYLPFWTFAGRVQIRCALEQRVPRAAYSPHERVIFKGEWPAEQSWFESEIEDLLVYAARSVTEEVIDQIAPFDTKAALAYRPEMLAGWQAEVYQVALEDAAVEATKRMRDETLKRAAKHLLFIEPANLLMDDVCVLDQTYKLILLPVWIARRTAAEGKIQLAVVNGQTGKTTGHRLGWLARLFA